MKKELKLVCSLCEYFARDQEDLESISKEGCCTECFNNFRYIFGKRWDAGERPTKEQARSKMHI
jgi:hypothetical protein|tara:strand:+ start:291 stop:482 length:192 start_codon:yes stop_codon:yes gene_type:complete